MEDKIRRVAAQLVAAKDDRAQMGKLVELRAALRQHMERLRTRLARYPIAQERRVENGIQTPGIAIPESAIETASRTKTIEITKPETPATSSEPNSTNDKKVAS
jgi:hypothetical protein